MSAPDQVAAPSVKWWQHYGGPKALVVPALVVLVLGVYGVKQVTKQPDPAEQNAATQQAAAAGAASAVNRALGSAAGPSTTTTITPAPVPLYDYLSCSHLFPGDHTPCSPLFPWPITRGAKEMIGYQEGGITDELSTVKSRIVADQIRNNMAGVDPCQLWLSVERGEDTKPTYTVWSSQAKAPQGAVKLYDCTPSGSTKGTIPTEGTS